MKRIIAGFIALAIVIVTTGFVSSDNPTNAKANNHAAPRITRTAYLTAAKHKKRRKHHRRVVHRPILYSATASWYNDSGSHCCGVYAHYGVATCGNQVDVCYPQGTPITFYYHGNKVTAIVDDHGPYANGAAFDLNQNVVDALGFSGVDTVYYSVGRR